ncbi:RTA1 like protein [Penicillium manginii]|uniref:RTA1 like protein n=1 Tax=Penicillium manginii TaxID=203109 RepID=UPI002546EB4F|nr:RTA1 like protein [Penicillium manginii]KAJ5756642.1 RTA1 like protein [Penicillium manginii]
MPYCIQAVFILLGPALFAASVYMVLARIIRSAKPEKHSTFVFSDVLTFLLQAGASGMMATSSLTNIGQAVIIAGLALQVLSFGLIIVTAVMFQRRVHDHPTPEAFEGCVPWKQVNSLYVISGFILLRSIFRVVEYAMGNEGYPLSNEWTLYTFDSVPMINDYCHGHLWDLLPERTTAIPKR